MLPFLSSPNRIDKAVSIVETTAQDIGSHHCCQCVPFQFFVCTPPWWLTGQLTPPPSVAGDKGTVGSWQLPDLICHWSHPGQARRDHSPPCASVSFMSSLAVHFVHLLYFLQHRVLEPTLSSALIYTGDKNIHGAVILTLQDGNSYPYLAAPYCYIDRRHRRWQQSPWSHSSGLLSSGADMQQQKLL